MSQWADREAALAWFALFEAMRLEARLAQELPGLARDIRLLRGPWPADLAAAADDLARPAATAADSLRWVASDEELALAGRRFLPTSPVLIRSPRGACAPHASRAMRRPCGGRSTSCAPTIRMRAAGPATIPIRRWPPRAMRCRPICCPATSRPCRRMSQAAAQSLAQDLDGMPPEIQPAGPCAWQPEERDAGETIVATVAGKPDAYL